MSLAELLQERGISRALIVDDVLDEVPIASDIDPGSEAWPIFNDDLQDHHQALIVAAYPPAAVRPLDELVGDDAYVATIWALRDQLDGLADLVFEAYLVAQTGDRKDVDLVRTKLEALGLEVTGSGRDFEHLAGGADLIVIDLFLNKKQNHEAIEESKERLKRAILYRSDNPPLVILMSRSPRLAMKREEFRDEVGLIDSGFRIIAKSDLEGTERLELQLERLAENAPDTRDLARFFFEIERGMKSATDRTLTLMRKLRLSDIGQIQQLLLNVEGEPVGSYLVDVFDRVLQHEIEGEVGIIDAAARLNSFSEARHPPPYVAGSPDLQAIVERLLTQNRERIRLPGAIDAVVSFGDILVATEGANLERLQHSLLVDMAPDKVLLVLTPVCDLQRGGAPRVLLLVGERRALSVKDWSYGDEAKTAAIRLGDDPDWIKWDLKHIDTASHDQLEKALNDGDLVVGARLREAHTLELQQRLLSGLGRVGLVANLPATFPVDVEAYYCGSDERPSRLSVNSLNEGAVCYVGRDKDGDPVLKLIFTEDECDELIKRLNEIAPHQVATKSQTAFAHVTSSPDLRQVLTEGLSLKGAGATGWTHIPSETGSNKDPRVLQMGLLAWNYAIPDEAIQHRDLVKAGIILLVKDASAAGAPGLNEAIKSGLLIGEPIPIEEEAEPAVAKPAAAKAAAAAPVSVTVRPERAPENEN